MADKKKKRSSISSQLEELRAMREASVRRQAGEKVTGEQQLKQNRAYAAEQKSNQRKQSESGGMGKPKAKPAAPAAAKPKPKPAAAAPAKPKPAKPVAAKPKPKPAASGYKDGQIVVKEGNRFRYDAASKTFKPVGYQGKGARRAATTSDRGGYRDGQIVVKEGNRFRYDAATKTFKPVKATGQGRGRRYNR
jgi:hypothetical protein